MTEKRISAVYIVKNEEKNLEKSIMSLRDAVDEIIVVDTGSTDNTKIIAEKLGAIIYDFEWVQDFSAARNFAISKATGDYIIFLDADEYFQYILTTESKEKIIELMESNEGFDSISFKFIDTDKNTKVIHHITYAIRCFKNDGIVKYYNTIHEYLAKNENEYVSTIVLDTMPIIHTGYNADSSVSKVERNLEILEAIKDKKAQDYFYLCREHLTLNEFDKAEENLKNFFNCEDYQIQIDCTDLIYNIYFLELELKKRQLDTKYNKEDILAQLKKMEEKIPHIPQVYYEYGLYYFSENFELAESYFKECAYKEKELQESECSQLDAYDSYKSHMYFLWSQIDLSRGQRQSAINKNGVACAWEKSNLEYANRLFCLLNHDRSSKTILKNIEFITGLFAPKTKQDYIVLVKALANTGLIEEFVNFAISLIKTKGLTQDDICNELYYAELLGSNDPEVIIQKIKDANNSSADMIRLVCLIYQASCQENIDSIISEVIKLPLEHRKVFELLVNLQYNKEDFDDKTKELASRTIIKMMYMGFVDFNNEFLKILIDVLGYSQYMSDIIRAYCNNMTIGRFIKSLEILNQCEESKLIIDKQLFYDDYLFCLYYSQDFDNFIIKSKQILDENPKIALPWNLIKEAKPKKSLIKTQRELIKQKV